MEWMVIEYQSKVTCVGIFESLGAGCKGAYEVCGDVDDAK